MFQIQYTVVPTRTEIGTGGKDRRNVSTGEETGAVSIPP